MKKLILIRKSESVRSFLVVRKSKSPSVILNGISSFHEVYRVLNTTDELNKRLYRVEVIDRLQGDGEVFLLYLKTFEHLKLGLAHFFLRYNSDGGLHLLLWAAFLGHGYWRSCWSNIRCCFLLLGCLGDFLNHFRSGDNISRKLKPTIFLFHAELDSL